MRFPVYFKRRVGAGTDPVLGTDATPVVSTPPMQGKDNILSHRLQRPLKRIAIGYWYEGVGVAVTLPVAIWTLDENSGKWFKAAAGTLTNGEMTYLRNPSLADPPQVQANLAVPGHGATVMIVIADNTGPTGTYHFVVGPDSSEF